MRVEKIMVTIVLLAGLLNGFGFALAADSTAKAADLEKLQEQFRVLDKDLAILKEISAVKLDTQDKRISDIGLATAQHANHLSAISNQTTAVGNYIAWTSGVITLLVLAAGLITYFSATRRVKEESREWFEKNTARLHREIEALQAKVQTASGEIDGHKEQVAISSKAALAHVQSEKNKFEAAASKILQTMQPEDEGSAPVIDAESAAVVQRASDELKAIPESSFTAEDHFARGLSQIANKNHFSALESFKAASGVLHETAAPDQRVRYLVAQAIALAALDKSYEAIAIYKEIDRLFGDDDSPDVRRLVAMALINKGARLVALSKPLEAIAVYDNVDRRFGNDESPGVREQVVKAHLGKAISLGKSEEAMAVYDGIHSRFGQDKTLGVRLLVAHARNGAAFWRILSAKQNWQDVSRKAELLLTAIKELEGALLTCPDDDRAMMLGNLGYALLLSGNSAGAAEPTRDCLRLGGGKSLAAQRGDAEQHRVEPEDSNYEALLAAVWAELHPVRDLVATDS